MVAATFAEPALGPQAVFRTLLDALAAPGRPVGLQGALPEPPTPLSAGLYAAALALVDFESPVWLADDFRGAAPDLRFHTGAPLVEAPAAAVFALARAATRLPALAEFNQGADAYPDRSTTLLWDVAGLHTDGSWRLHGPGIKDARRLRVDGLPDDFGRQWALNGERFPRGVDVFLFAGRTVVGLPRTTRIEEG